MRNGYITKISEISKWAESINKASSINDIIAQTIQLIEYLTKSSSILFYIKQNSHYRQINSSQAQKATPDEVITQNQIKDLVTDNSAIQKIEANHKVFQVIKVNKRKPKVILCVQESPISETDKKLLMIIISHLENLLPKTEKIENDIISSLVAIEEIVKVIEKSSEAQNFGNSIVNLIIHELGYQAALFISINTNTFHYSHKGISSFRKQADSLAKKYTKGLANKFLDEQNTIGRSIKTKKIIFSKDFLSIYNPPFPKSVLKLIHRLLPFKESVIIPCVNRNTVEAVIVVGSFDHIKTAQKEVLRILQREIAYALQNKRLITQMRQENNDLLRIFENIFEGIFIFKDKIRFANSKLTEITEYKLEELMQIKNLQKHLIPEERKKLIEYLAQREKGVNFPKELETKIITKSGRILDVEIRINPIIFQNEEMYLIGLRDITQQKNYTIRLKDMYHKQAEIFSEIAHSLKTPFTIINGYLDLVLRNYEDQKFTKKTTQTIKNELKSANKKVTKLLDVAKLDLRQYDIKFQKIKSEDFIEAVYVKAKSMGYKYCNMQHSSSCDCLKLLFNENIEIEIDTDAIMDVLMTLIENAYLHSKKSEDKYDINLSSKVKKDYLEIVVEDKGRGIQPRLLPKLFEPFSRIHHSQGSHGIGLPMCKKLIEEHDGKLSVRSKVNIGTKMTILLPISRA